MMLSIFGACLGLLLGLLGLLAPAKALRLVGLSLNPDAPHGVSEVRATYGGLFIGLELSVMALAMPAGFLVAGMAWLGAGLARLVSMLVDRTPSRQNWGGVAVELVIGALHCSAVMLPTMAA